MTSKHAHGVSATYGYDDLNRLTSVVDGRVAQVLMVKSKFPPPQTMGAPGLDSETWDSMDYDSMNRLTAKATPEGTLNYTHDAAGHVASISSENINGVSMSYTCDELDRLSAAVDNG